MVTEIKFDEEDQVVSCAIEAVMTKRTIPITWSDLKDEDIWLYGWK